MISGDEDGQWSQGLISAVSNLFRICMFVYFLFPYRCIRLFICSFFILLLLLFDDFHTINILLTPCSFNI